MKITERGVCYADFFRNYMREIDEKLTAVGLPTCTVKPKSSKQSVTVEVNADMSKFGLKLRAIAKHTEALADELDAIDSAWQCECGSTEYTTFYECNVLTDNQCTGCGKHFSLPNDDELPTQLEGSD